MKPLTPEQALRLVRRHWKTISDLIGAHHLLDMTDDADIVALTNYLNAARELDRKLDTKKSRKEGK